MKIKVCGMRDAHNVSEVERLGVDMIGFIFCRQSKRFVSMLPSMSGTVPNYVSSTQMQGSCLSGMADQHSAARVGVFVDDMPQNIVTAVYGYGLDYIQLHGNESPVMIDNLRRTIDPDIRPDIKIIKALSVESAADICRWREYAGHADLLLFDTKGKEKGGNGIHFDWSLLDTYDGDVPFILSGGIGPEDSEAVKSFNHPSFWGIDLNSRFELQPALKDVGKLEKFISELRN